MPSLNPDVEWVRGFAKKKDRELTPFFAGRERERTFIAGQVAEVARNQAAGSDPNATDSPGRTPLHACAAEDRPATAALLKAGASPKARDGEGRMPRREANPANCPRKP